MIESVGMEHDPRPEQRLDPPETRRASKRLTRSLILACISVPVLAACSSSDDRRGVSDTPRFDKPALIAALRDAGSEPQRQGLRRFDKNFGTIALTYCVDRSRMDVHEYRDRAERRSVSRTVSKDGVVVGNSVIAWAGPPYFYARGRIIVLVVGNAPKLNTRLAKILGPTLSPDAEPGRGTPAGIRCSLSHDEQHHR